MAKKPTTQKPLETYIHDDKQRLNNPPIGLVTPKTDPDKGDRKTYQYDPHLDPALQWAGKAEHTRFDVPTVSLHVHERIDPKTIMDAVKKEKQDGGQLSLFDDDKPLREALAFYQHKENWSNRLIAGDSLLVMNSLLEKEGYAGKVQMIYFDPPYGIKYGSNFQPFVNKRDVKDGKDEDLTAEPEMIKAFRDTWELGIHSYLTYLRDRLLLARELLSESGSVFVQISDENVHHVREIMDEIFTVDNFCSIISFRKTTGQSGKLLSDTNDYLIWYAKNKATVKFRSLFIPREGFNWVNYDFVMLPNGEHRKMTKEEIENPDLLPQGTKIYRRDNLTSASSSKTTSMAVEFEGKSYKPGKGGWKTNEKGFENLKNANRLEAYSETLSYRRYADDFPYFPISNSWIDTASGGYSADKVYVVQTNQKVIQRCMLMTTDPSDLVLDITCGSGTTAYVAEQWGRRWITCDTSRVALTLAKQRLMTALFDYYQLARPSEGIASGFVYKTVPHITLKSIANNEPPATETLYDQPLKDNRLARVTSPFTVEAVPAPYALSLDDVENSVADHSIARSGETHRHNEWRDELLKTGVRAKNGQIIEFSCVETLSGTQYSQAIAETKEDNPKKVLVVFGSEFAPLPKKTVENAVDEARFLKPDILLFCAFMFEEEAAKDIDEMPAHLLGFQLLKAQMNADLLTDDLRKKRASNESFWLIGQPDVRVMDLPDGMIQVEVLGFDYYNPKNGNIESGGKHNIAMWLLDTDYDGRSLFPKQVFFPMAGSGEAWDKLARNLKAEIDEEKIEAFAGTLSLPFARHHKIAVKIIDDRGIECLRVIKL
jgi:adenine-specific DNA-methyltransferase